MVRHYIYITTNKINGKKYIGQRLTRLEGKVDMVNDNYFGSGTLLIKAIKKHGKGNFTKEIVMVTESQRTADGYEIALIKKYNATNSPLFYNIAYGGQYSRSENHSSKMSEIMKAKWRDPEYKAKCLKDKIDRKNEMFSDEYKYATRLVFTLRRVKKVKEKEERALKIKNMGFKSYQDYLRSIGKMGGNLKGIKHNRKGYGKYSNKQLNSLVHDNFKSKEEAGNALGIHRTTILNQCRGWMNRNGVRVSVKVKDQVYERLEGLL